MIFLFSQKQFAAYQISNARITKYWFSWQNFKVYFFQLGMTFHGMGPCMVKLPCPSIKCSAIPKIFMLSLVISLVMTCSFAVFAPLMFHVANTAFFRRWIPFLSILRPSGAALPDHMKYIFEQHLTEKPFCFYPFFLKIIRNVQLITTCLHAKCDTTGIWYSQHLKCCTLCLQITFARV